MLKILGLAIAALLVLGVLLDPCTFRVNAAHGVGAAPWWQMLLSGIDIALIATAVAYGHEERFRVGIRLLLIEMMYNVGLSMGLVIVHGLSRYAVHFGHSEGLILYLAWFALRIALLWMWVEQIPAEAIRD